jgi:cell volume regulation protein A
MTIERNMLIAAVLLIVSVLATKVSGRLGVPALVVFLVIGMLAGSEGIGGIYFDDAVLTQEVGTVALAFILFSGGLDTRIRAVRPVIWRGALLATFGVVATMLLMAGFAVYVLGFALLPALLFGAVVSSTDAAAVFGVLSSRSSGVDPEVRTLVELESGSNDPMAAVLTLGMTQLILQPEKGVFDLALFFVQQMLVGGVAGIVLGYVGVWMIDRARLQSEGLYTVLSLAMVLAIYGGTASIGGNGFLAVYLAGIVIGSREVLHRRELVRFHDGLAWIMQVVMFLVLGLLVFPSQLAPVAGMGFAAAAFLVLVARPAAVLLSLAPFRMNVRRMAAVSWLGMRGAVPIVLATFPATYGVPDSDLLFDLVFFIVLTSVVVQGATMTWAARLAPRRVGSREEKREEK